MDCRQPSWTPKQSFRCSSGIPSDTEGGLALVGFAIGWQLGYPIPLIGMGYFLVGVAAGTAAFKAMDQHLETTAAAAKAGGNISDPASLSRGAVTRAEMAGLVLAGIGLVGLIVLVIYAA